MRSNFDRAEQDEIFTKVQKAGKRTYFFDVRQTKAGDHFLTITESKKNYSEDGDMSVSKHKIYLYPEDMQNFTQSLNEVISFIDTKNKGISADFG